MNSRTNILHLDYDVLKEILVVVVACAGGATYLAKIMTVCKAFAKLGEDECILTMVNFDNFALSESVENWVHIKSLLTRCAEAGHARARYILAKVILLGNSQFLASESSYNKRHTLLHTDQASSSSAVEQISLHPFLSYFTLDQATTNDPKRKRFTHFELVSLFLKQCSIADHVSMLPHVQNYVEHYGFGNKRCKKFFDCFHTMTGFLRAIVDMGLETDGQIEQEIIDAYDVVQNLRMKVNHFFVSTNRVLSRPDWERLKRESHFIDELLSSGSSTNSIDKNHNIGDLEEGFFYYIIFNVLTTWEIYLPLDVMDDLLDESIVLAENYTTWRKKTTLAFDGIFLPKKRV